MDKELFSKLMDLVAKNEVLIEISRRYSGAALGGKTGGFLFTLLFLGGVVGGLNFLFKAMFLYAFAALIGLILLLIIWSKIAVYYFSIRSGSDYDFFSTAYATGIIRLRVKDSDIFVGSPEPWNAIFTAVETSKDPSKKGMKTDQ